MKTAARLDGNWLAGVELEALSDEAYLRLMEACARQVCDLRAELRMMLIECDRRDLARPSGYRDIYEMAEAEARMTRSEVDEILRVARAVQCCPRLWQLHVEGQVSWSKLRAVAPLARPERDEELCASALELNGRSLRGWVKKRIAT